MHKTPEPPRLQLSLMQTQLSQSGWLPSAHFLYLALRKAEREKPLPRRRLHARDVICSHTNTHTPVYHWHAMSSTFYGIHRWYYSILFKTWTGLGSTSLLPLTLNGTWGQTQWIRSTQWLEHSLNTMFHVNIWWRQFKEKNVSLNREKNSSGNALYSHMCLENVLSQPRLTQSNKALFYNALLLL